MCKDAMHSSMHSWRQHMHNGWNLVSAVLRSGFSKGKAGGKRGPYNADCHPRQGEEVDGQAQGPQAEGPWLEVGGLPHAQRYRDAICAGRAVQSANFG